MRVIWDGVLSIPQESYEKVLMALKSLALAGTQLFQWQARLYCCLREQQYFVDYCCGLRLGLRSLPLRESETGQ